MRQNSRYTVTILDYKSMVPATKEVEVVAAQIEIKDNGTIVFKELNRLHEYTIVRIFAHRYWVSVERITPNE